MNVEELREYFGSKKELPKLFKPDGCTTVTDVRRFINDCFQEIDSPNELQRIKEIRAEWLVKLKNELENPGFKINPHDLYIIRTAPDIADCFKLEWSEYESLRNKISERLLMFYDTVECTDAGMEFYDINFYCMVGDHHGAIQIFNVEDWIGFERSGRFDEEYKSVQNEIEFQSGWAKS